MNRGRKSETKLRSCSQPQIQAPKEMGQTMCLSLLFSTNCLTVWWACFVGAFFALCANLAENLFPGGQHSGVHLLRRDAGPFYLLNAVPSLISWLGVAANTTKEEPQKPNVKLGDQYCQCISPKSGMTKWLIRRSSLCCKKKLVLGINLRLQPERRER
jgi:hypothetical protein